MSYLGGNRLRDGAEGLLSRYVAIRSSGPTPLLIGLAGRVARTIFIIVFSAVALAVSFPQDAMSRPLTHYSFVDFARCAIGIAICVGMTIQIGRLPRGGEDGYRAWAFIGSIMLTVLIIFTALKIVFPGAA